MKPHERTQHVPATSSHPEARAGKLDRPTGRIRSGSHRAFLATPDRARGWRATFLGL